MQIMKIVVEDEKIGILDCECRLSAEVIDYVGGSASA